MSSLQAFTQDNYILSGGQGPYYSVLGYGSVGVAIAGTFTSGTLKFQGTNDGNTWTDLQVLSASIPLANDEIVATGNYVCGVVSYQSVRILATSFLGQLSVTASISPQIVLSTIEGGDIVVDSLTINDIENAALATDANGLVYGVTGLSGDVMRLSGTGSIDLFAVTYNNSNLYVAVGTGSVFTSSTGTGNWISRSIPTGQTLLSVAWSGTSYVACGTTGSIISSTDGITWTLQTSGVAVSLSCVRWDATNSQWIIVGSTQTVLTSPDAVTWTSRTYGTTNAIRGVAPGASVIVAVGASGVIKTSPTGVTWTLRTSGVATELYAISWDTTNSQFIAVGASGVILTSPDGTTWTPRTSGVSTFLRGIAWGNSRYTAVGASGVILSSSDGATWIAETSGTSSELYGILTATTPLFVAVGVSGIRLTSPDGDTWTPVSQLVWFASTPSGTGALLAKDSATATNFTVTGRVTESDTFTAGANFAAGEVGYLGSGGTVLKASNAAVATAEGMMLVASAAVSSAASGVFIGRGRIAISGAAFTVGGKIYLGASGALTQTAPTATTTAIRILGYAFSSTVMSFMPDNTYVENP